MISGQGEAAVRTYKEYFGKSGRIWLVAVQDNPADNIYVEGGPNSDGFGGATLTFKLEDGREVRLKGPWHSNSNALFEDTGMDIRNQHETEGAIGTDREYIENRLIIKNCLYVDKGAVVGEFDRLGKLAQAFADDMRIPVVCYSASRGGSSCGFKWPSGSTYRDWEYDKVNKKWSRKNDATSAV